MPKKINPNAMRTRDLTLVKVINGATKASVHKDKKKEASKKACREKVKKDG